MSTADGWDLTVPDDANELLAELRRHGVVPGQRLRVVPGVGQEPTVADEPTVQRRSMEFIASFAAEPDLGRNADEYLAEGFGRD
ncbi:hypothetical protein GCM10023328_03650 [Modestobacter marinus]|uniref:Uncharacterized protein n=1 Tax=Modestobacter marinus TaxID=477641 RepID=A0A846LM72_9ACTN|nr:hypothetical protein [Modestobacter marinus]NIH67212.1 hypothetical protein [Modestobacter marinus]GGL52913.1 hypothetical protein GCM10011589_06320 [Modestobacter marinus]